MATNKQPEIEIVGCHLKNCLLICKTKHVQHAQILISFVVLLKSMVGQHKKLIRVCKVCNVVKIILMVSQILKWKVKGPKYKVKIMR